MSFKHAAVFKGIVPTVLHYFCGTVRYSLWPTRG